MQESGRAPITGASHGEGASAPVLAVPGDGKVTDRVDPECSDRKVPLTGRLWFNSCGNRIVLGCEKMALKCPQHRYGSLSWPCFTSSHLCSEFTAF